MSILSYYKFKFEEEVTKGEVVKTATQSKSGEKMTCKKKQRKAKKGAKCRLKTGFKPASKSGSEAQADVEPDNDGSETEEYEVEGTDDTCSHKQQADSHAAKRKKQPKQQRHRENFKTNHAAWEGFPADNNDKDLPSPLHYFQRYIDGEFFKIAAEQTNQYSIQQTGSCVKTDSKEMRRLFAVHLFLGILKFPRLRMYWNDKT